MDPITSMAVEAAGKWVMNEVKMLCGVKEQVEEMKVEFQWMQSFLEDADRRVSSQSEERQSRVFRQWAVQVREASLDAEDIIDDYLVKLALRNRSGVINFIKRYGCILKHGIDIHVVGSQIEALSSKLSRLRLRLQTYGVIRKLGSASSSGVYPKPLQRRSNGHIPNLNVVGLEENINQVVGLLLQEGEEKCKVVSIHGMGGLGKTTLAKEVYNDKRVRKHFDKFAWVHVSKQFNESDVWESTLKQLGEKWNAGQLVEKLYQVQKDNKCVVVLDDIWSIEDWKKLHPGFPLDERSISTILFTTRNKEVSEHANKHANSYGELKLLKDPEAMQLLRKIAFKERDIEMTEKEIEEVGGEMLKHCGGLPLAITILGGILANKNSLSEWHTVRDNITPYLRRGKGHDKEDGLGVHQVLAYSYYDLPSQLRTCFLYLSQYPEDHEINADVLMKMWMAEGFVSVEYDGEGEETVEDVAEQYLNELVDRCVVEVGRKDYIGRVKTCRLHDMMRDVCLSKAREESLIHRYKRDAVTKGNVRRLSFIEVEDSNEKISLAGYETHSHIRSLIIIYVQVFWRLEVSLSIRFKWLKMLVLQQLKMKHMKGLPKQIAQLIHLRYLSLQMSEIYDWPSLDKLGCMETLDLRICRVESKLPLKMGEIWKMKRLRHLYLPDFDVRYSTGDNMPIESNSNLQTLVNFPPFSQVSRILNKFPNLRKLILWEGKHLVELWEILNNNKGFSLSRLRSFSLISGDLHNEKVDLGAIFIMCPHLYKLRLNCPVKKFPQFNQFPTELIKLFLRNSEIEDPEDIETTLGNLPHLKSLDLKENAFKGETLSFKKDTFPKLTTLSLSSLKELTNWIVEGAMPNFEHLEICCVKKLEAIPKGLGFIVTLKELEIAYMPYKFKERLTKGGADFDTVKHVSSISFLDIN